MAKGRHWLGFWLVFFLVILGWVVARNTTSHVLAGELSDSRAERSLLEGRKAELLRRIRTASSRAVLIPRVQARGFRLPADSEIIILQVPNPEPR